MQVIRQVVNREELLFLARNDARDVLLQFVVVLGRDEVLPAFDGKHDLDIDLGVCVRHERRIALLTELGILLWVRFYKDTAPGRAEERSRGLWFYKDRAPDGAWE